MLKLKFQYFGHLVQRANSLEKTLNLGKTEGKKGREQQQVRQLDSITDSVDRVCANSERWWRTGKPRVLQSMGSQRVGQDIVTIKQQDCSPPGSSAHGVFQARILEWVIISFSRGSS